MGQFGQGRSERSAFITYTAVAASASLLGACGGGGGGVGSAGSSPPPAAAPAPTPTPTPTPIPTPTPTPPPTSADSAEYKASNAVVGAKAAYAYDRNITGRGVTVAVIDSGVVTSSAEFAGRISADSRAIEQRFARCGTCAPETVTFDIRDIVGHGSQVASVLAAARDGAGIQGLAPDATILAIKVNGVDLSSGEARESQFVNTASIAPAIRYSLDRGAFVLNLSVNGAAGGQIATDLRAAMDGVRAQNRLLVQSVDNVVGDSFAGQITQDMVGADLANKDWFLFGIGLDADLRPLTSNGRPGVLADRTLAAVSTNVRAVDKDGSLTTVTGNSFAAPAIAGAAALLKQYWPQLGGKEIGRILLDTARDLGAPGVDQIYGAGLLDVENAMKAQAPAASFAAAGQVLGRFSSIATSAPFGGTSAAAAIARETGGMTVLDRYGRDYLMMGDTGPASQRSGLLAGTMVQPASYLAAQPSDAEHRLGITSRTLAANGQVRASQPIGFAFSPAANQTVAIASNVGVGVGTGLGGGALRGVTTALVGTTGDWNVSGWRMSYSTGSSRDAAGSLRTIGMASPLGIGFELTELAERNGVLGMLGGPAAGLGDGRTTLVTLVVERDALGLAWTARATAGRTRVVGGADAFRFDGPIASTAYAVTAGRSLLGGFATFGMSSPLRVERARASLLVPATYDLMTGALTEERRTIDLKPTAREATVELGWAAALSARFSLRLGVARSANAGHVAGAADTAGHLTLVLR